MIARLIKENQTTYRINYAQMDLSAVSWKTNIIASYWLCQCIGIEHQSLGGAMGASERMSINIDIDNRFYFGQLNVQTNLVHIKLSNEMQQKADWVPERIMFNQLHPERDNETIVRTREVSSTSPRPAYFEENEYTCYF